MLDVGILPLAYIATCVHLLIGTIVFFLMEAGSCCDSESPTYDYGNSPSAILHTFHDEDGGIAGGNAGGGSGCRGVLSASGCSGPPIACGGGGGGSDAMPMARGENL